MKKLLTACLLATLSLWAVADDNCAMCHDSPPVPEGHMPVTEVSVAACMMCHAPDQEDPLFVKLHTVHSDMGLGCDSCHGDASAERQSRLDALLPRP